MAMLLIFFSSICVFGGYFCESRAYYCYNLQSISGFSFRCFLFFVFPHENLWLFTRLLFYLSTNSILSFYNNPKGRLNKLTGVSWISY
uniref:Putative secreted protein n=1 Tax=Lutzomyia longipalpis TaxID=7200 RepID=A0A7G3AGW7_LUTLO